MGALVSVPPVTNRPVFHDPPLESRESTPALRTSPTVVRAALPWTPSPCTTTVSPAAMLPLKVLCPVTTKVAGPAEPGPRFRAELTSVAVPAREPPSKSSTPPETTSPAWAVRLPASTASVPETVNPCVTVREPPSSTSELETCKLLTVAEPSER